MHDRLTTAAVVGLGGMGKHHVSAILENPSCTLKYVTDLNESVVREFKENNNCPNVVCASLEEILSDSDVNLICIASYDDAHFEQVRSCLNANKHIFVEKPLCQTEQQLFDIVSLYKKSKAGIVSNLVLRTAPLYQYIKDLLSAGGLGEIYAFDGDYLYGRVQKITDGWRKDVPNYSVMEGGGIHMIDLMMWLSGQKPISVVSHINKIATKGTPFRYHDFQSSIFEFDSGLIGRITANFGCVHRHQHVVRIFGTKGTFIYDDQGARIHWGRDEDKASEYLDKLSKPIKKANLLHDFVDSLNSNNLDQLAIREFDLMSVVLASDKALNMNNKIEYVL